jgi:hypothetical protein
MPRDSLLRWEIGREKQQNKTDKPDMTTHCALNLSSDPKTPFLSAVG